MNRMKAGDLVEPRALESVRGDALPVPPAGGLLHLQFRRFAGCPICNLHLQSFIRRHAELVAAGIQEVAVFHSPKADMLGHQRNAPFAYIADPGKALYKVFGVETSILSVLDPRTWPAAIMGIVKVGPGFPGRGESPLGLPADFLIDATGRLAAVHYGAHASDQWELDEVLALAGGPRRQAA